MISYDDNTMGASIHRWSTESLLLRSLWIKVLPSMTEQEIDLCSNFFRMGGESTDAMKLVRLSRENGISSLSVSLVMRFPTLGEMADAIISGGEAQLTATATTTTTTTPATPATPSQNDSYIPFSLLEDMKRENVLSQAALQCQISLKHIADIYPCTPMQAGLMALTAHYSGAYWAKHKFELPSGWDLSKAGRCWQQVMAGNVILRTRIIQLDTGECFQVVPIPSRPGETLSAATFISTEASAFGQPLFQYTFEKNPSDSKVYMRWIIHHAIYDGWSTRLMLQALFDSYTADSLMIPFYPSFSSFVHYIMQNDGLESSKYWGHHLNGYEEQSFPRAAPSSVRPSAKITRTVSWKSKSSSVTASSTVRAAWAIVLSKYCSSPDIVFGVVVNGRSAAVLDTERIMGPTICTLPFRVKVEAGLTIQDLLESIQRQSGDMIPHEQFGLPGILALGEHGPAQATRFQSLVIVQPEELPVGSEHAQINEIIEGVDSYLTYPVTLECVLSHNCITLTLTIDESSISAFEADCLLNHFQHVFETIQRPSMGACRASTIDLITQSERALLTRWSAPVEPAVVSSCIEEVIINHSSQWLASDAVCSWDGNLTYSQLFSLSTALATQLTLKGSKLELLFRSRTKSPCGL
ncbi:acetyl-CoA synthetase-like protein [Penicillium frequentans]|uniref:Acetyl-CoA synthetase-like protein n=1 Tax=Penicillium frequentans TaxID=3151616 RepID=A0AAD6CY07_9EURO|nr:acetyl-CoA synthetase-like protein [Penicillium glabrum]